MHGMYIKTHTAIDAMSLVQWTLTNPTALEPKGVQSTEMFRFEKHVSIILFKLINLKFILKRFF